MSIAFAIIKQESWPKTASIPAYYDHNAIHLYISENYRNSMTRDWQTHFWIIWSLGWYKYMKHFGLKEAINGNGLGNRQADRFAFAYVFHYLKTEYKLNSIEQIKDSHFKELIKNVKIINQYFHNSSFILKYCPQK